MMPRKHAFVSLAVVGATLLASTGAWAHPGHGGATGFAHGVMHPFGGIDHVLAMVAVGLLAVTIGGRGIWALPLTFMGVMALGGMLGADGVSLPYAEVGIALSVVCLGATIAAGWRLPLAAALTMVALFGLFHGYAHGAEMPQALSALTYGLGFLAATGALHGVGIGIGIAAQAGGARIARRLAAAGGAAIAVAGTGLLAGLL